MDEAMLSDVISEEDAALLRGEIARQEFPLLFATISGAHLYGFASADSDFDVRGVHVLPLRDVVGLYGTRETIQSNRLRDGRELDVVTHDATKFFNLLLKKNGYVLEQLLSPLVLHTTPEHDELKRIARGLITRHHSHHYFGFAHTQWKLFEKENPPRVKPLLYLFRVLLTGIHLMRTGEVEANLATLNENFNLSYITELIGRKQTGAEKETLPNADIAFYKSEYERLCDELQTAHEATHLPDEPRSNGALNDLLVRVRLGWNTNQLESK
ncbi:MAG: nucleotidyltransferase domain-containing protein [Pyrinomonadaceae bacterium MAG19_C2-C3]|nr:nucleotidyltransferase domain-containing protein [Pyrinomonadaceae bacterium MAG19_C2-C3]